MAKRSKLPPGPYRRRRRDGTLGDVLWFWYRPPGSKPRSADEHPHVRPRGGGALHAPEALGGPPGESGADDRGDCQGGLPRPLASHPPPCWLRRVYIFPACCRVAWRVCQRPASRPRRAGTRRLAGVCGQPPRARGGEPARQHVAPASGRSAARNRAVPSRRELGALRDLSSASAAKPAGLGARAASRAPRSERVAGRTADCPSIGFVLPSSRFSERRLQRSTT